MENVNPHISAVVIAKNEESRIAICLDALSWASEVIVVDDHSTDTTRSIAKKAGARVVEGKGDFSHLRQMGAKAAHGQWILYVDADEVITDELHSEIRAVTASHRPGDPVAYRIRRTTYYLGSAWPAADRLERLFLKKTLVAWRGPLHETPVVRGLISSLVNPLIHNTHRSLAEMTAKTNEWSETEAKLRFDAHHPPVVWWRLLRVMGTGFTRSFFGQQGWKAGWVGWVESLYQAFSMFITYAKLWELQKKKDS